jgi:hypothetical protein
MGAVAPAVERSMRWRILLGLGINVLGAAAARIDVHLSSLVLLSLSPIFPSHRVVDSHWDRPEPTPQSGRVAG